MVRRPEELVESRRRALEEIRGEPFLTVQEAAEELGVTPGAIYGGRERYKVEAYLDSCFVPESVVHPPAEPLEIRGVEYMEGVGRVNVTRFLCLPCRQYFRTPETARTHPCFTRGRGGENR